MIIVLHFKVTLLLVVGWSFLYLVLQKEKTVTCKGGGSVNCIVQLVKNRYKIMDCVLQLTLLKTLSEDGVECEIANFLLSVQF